MSLILYPTTEKDFDSNGIGILADATDAEVYEELNGQFELTVKYPVSGLHFADIVTDAYITAKPDPVRDPQPFRIYRITKPMKGEVTIYARHNAYRNKKIVVSPFAASSAPAALQSMKESAVNDCPFEFWTDKSTAAKMTVAVPTDIWTLLGNSQGSILDTYGGEYEFDKYTVKLWNRRGADRGVSIRYGKNLTDLKMDENISNVYTGVYPYWADLDGNLVTLPEKTISGPGTYAEEKILPLDLSQAFQMQPTEEQLRERAENYIADNDIGKPDVSWTVEFTQLEQTEEYKGKALLERVLLGDTVSVVFPKLGVDVSARAVAARYKPSLGRYKNITLGKVRANIAYTIAQQNQEIQKRPEVTLMQSMIVTLTATILGAKGGAVRLLDTDGDGLQDTLYIGDNADPAKALKVWRFNYEGWATSKTGYNGPFIMGATIKDGLLAASVTAANLVAGYIQSKDGKTFFLDLDNGILKANFTELSIASKTVDEIAKDKVNAQTPQDVINRLTNNGAIQGIWFENGRVYVSGSIVKTGILTSEDGTVQIDLLNNKVIISSVSGSGYKGKVELSANGIVGYGWDVDANDFVKTLAFTPGDNLGNGQATTTGISSWYSDAGISIGPGKAGAAALWGNSQSETIIRGKVIKQEGPIILTEGVHYGDTLPTDCTAGRLFLKKVT